MKKAAFFFIIFFACTILSFAQEPVEQLQSMPDFKKNEHVLILAPHPDDEAIGTAGIIQKAVKAGAIVYVACYTNGDANQLAFIVYEKRFTFRKGEFVHMGEVRRKETIAALKFLGVDENNIFFLGYPDFGTMEILLKFWGPTRAYKSLFTRSSYVPYKENLSPKALYIGENILEDIESVLGRVKPVKIFVSHPADTNGDHQSLYLFLRIALWDMNDKFKNAQVYPYLIHCAGWPKPRGFHPNLTLSPPHGFTGAQVTWKKLDLTQDEIKNKNKSLDFYKSQIPYNPVYLPTFARKNELFSDYSVITLDESEANSIGWQYAHGPEDAQDKDDAVFLSYAKKENKFYIKFTLPRKITKAVTSQVYLLPYSAIKDFSGMPKIRLVITRNKLLIYDKRSRIFVRNVDMKVGDDSIIIGLPLVVLNSPDFILCRGRIYTEMPKSDISAWRVLKLNEEK